MYASAGAYLAAGAGGGGYVSGGGGGGGPSSSAAAAGRPGARGHHDAFGGVNFTPSEFAHNARVACALVPALAVVAAVGGPLTAAVLTTGALLAYAADALALREGALLAGWLSLAGASAALASRVLGPAARSAAVRAAAAASSGAAAAAAASSRALLLAALVTAACALAALLAGCWLTLQFRAVQLRHPALVLALERLVVSASVPVGAAVQTLGGAALLTGDLSAAPYVLLLALVALYHALARPLVSSFHVCRGRAVGGSLGGVGGGYGGGYGGGGGGGSAGPMPPPQHQNQQQQQQQQQTTTATTSRRRRPGGLAAAGDGGSGGEEGADDGGGGVGGGGGGDPRSHPPSYAAAAPYFLPEDTPPAAVVQGPLDSALSALAVAALPSAVYLALHGPALLAAEPLLHLWSVLLLSGAGVSYLALAPQGMWWLPGPRLLAGPARLLAACLGAAMLVAGFEGRVVFRGFSAYIPLPRPYSYLAVAVALSGVAALGIAHAYGAIGFGDLGGDGVAALLPLDSTFASACLMLAAAAASLAMGVPPKWLPAPLAAAAGLSLTYATGGLREYCVFVAGGSATAAWLALHHFGFLFGDESGIALASMSLRDLVRLALAAVVPALLLPGAALAAGFGGGGGFAAAAAAPRGLVGLLLVAQAALVAVCEERMHAAPRVAGVGGGGGGGGSSAAGAVVYDEVMYPPWLVSATSAAGLAAGSRLLAVGLAPRWAAWCAGCLYAGKLAMLVVPENRMVLPVSLALLAAAAPLFLHEPPPDAEGGSSAAAASSRRQRLRNVSVAYRDPSSDPYRERNFARGVRIPPALGALHALVALALLAAARFALFDAVVWAAEGGRPTEATLLGALLVAAAASLSPLVLRCYAHAPSARRLLASLAVAGALVAHLQPPLPTSDWGIFSFGSRCPDLPLALCWRLWDERHVPARSEDDAAVWGAALLTGEGGGGHAWHRWLLVAAAAVASLSLSLAPAGGVRGGGGGGGAGAGGKLLQGVGVGGGGDWGAGAAGVLGGPLLRLAAALACGALVGDYLAIELVPAQPLLQALLVASALLLLSAVVLVQSAAATAAAAGGAGGRDDAPSSRRHGGGGGGGGGGGRATSISGSAAAAAAGRAVRRAAKRASAAALPALLLLAWLGVAAAALLVQPLLPLPDIHRFRRLFPDAGLGGADAERRAAARASLVAAFGGQALVLALALKLSIRRALGPIDADDPEDDIAGAGGGGGGSDDYVSAVRAAAVAAAGIGGGAAAAAQAAQAAQAAAARARAAGAAGDAFSRELERAASGAALAGSGGSGLLLLQQQQRRRSGSGLGLAAGLASRTSSAASLLLGPAAAEGLMDKLGGLLAAGGAHPQPPSPSGGGGGGGAASSDAGEETPAARAARVRRLRACGLAWAPVACNASACLALLAALDLNLHVTGGAPEPVFAAAPALLLLVRDGALLSRLAPRRRYAPPFFLIAAYLSLRAAAEALGWAHGYTEDRWLRQVPALLAALPSQALWISHLWAVVPARAAPRGWGAVAASAVLALAALAASPLESVAYLGASGLCYCGLVLLRGRRIKAVARRRL
jgi:hypothetical protein